MAIEEFVFNGRCAMSELKNDLGVALRMELATYAPGMKLLAMDTANLEAEGTMQLVSAWLTKHGSELKGVILACDGFGMTGTLEAVKKAGREDLVIVAAGNSKPAGPAGSPWIRSSICQVYHHPQRRGYVYAGAVVSVREGGGIRGPWTVISRTRVLKG
jgi:ABC-type sugar transport system substrate-binding protein